MIDDHAHPFDLEPGPLDLTHVTLDLVEGPVAEERRAGLRPTYLWHALFSRRLATRLGCAVEDLESTRGEAAREDYRAYVRALFADAGIEEIVMDAAWPAGAADRIEEYEDLSGCRIHRMFRIDTVVDRLLEEGAGFDDVVAAFDGALEDARRRGHVALKTILAYRTGLRVEPDVSQREARAALPGEGPVRRRAKPLRDFLLGRAVAFAADTGLVVQIHTGIGDSEIRLAEANPLLLEELLRTPEAGRAAIVLIHGAYPYHEEAAYLASVRPSVHVDFSLFNIFAPGMVADRLFRIVEIAPVAKVLAGTDGFAVPETYWFAATMAHEAWDRVRGELRALGTDEGWIEDATRMIFEDNARRLYGL